MAIEDTHSAECLLLPGNPLPAQVELARLLPCFVILVHGVNDLGEAYSAQESGICAGLNQRLHRNDLRPAHYRLPPARDDVSPAAQKDLHTVLEDPDAVYYKRSVDPANAWNSVVPFYWGSRTADQPTYKNHLRVDKAGNRVDSNGAKGGGPVANATSNLVDMWARGFDPWVLGGALDLNAHANQPTHPLLHADERRYMVLAAQRLAMVVEIIHKWNPHAAVNLVAHSQGCLVSLLAQAILAKRGKRPADCLILNHPCYGLEEPLLDALTQTHGQQQTTHARVATLSQLVQFVTQSPQAHPSLATLLDPKRNGGFTGVPKDPGNPSDPVPCAALLPQPGKAPATLLDLARSAGILKAPKVPGYADRDNRGRVFLYFCPEDATVGLLTMQGIGWQGVPEHKNGKPVLAALGPRFHQRVWTMRARKGIVPRVGEGTRYVLREPHEKFWPALTSEWRATPVEGDDRILASGVSLPAPFRPNLRFGESKGHAGFVDVGPCDAAIALTNEGEQKTIDPATGLAMPLSRDDVDDWRGPHCGPGRLGRRDLEELEKRLNAGKAEEAKVKVLSAERFHNGKLWVKYQETDTAARIRWQTQELEVNSYHSAIVSNPDHSKHVTAWDLALGPARICKDQSKAKSYKAWVEETKNFVLYLCTIADWRMKSKSLNLVRKDPDLQWFFAQDEEHKTLLDATANYYDMGILPEDHLFKYEDLPLILSQTISEHLQGVVTRVQQGVRSRIQQVRNFHPLT